MSLQSLSIAFFSLYLFPFISGMKRSGKQIYTTPKTLCRLFNAYRYILVIQTRSGTAFYGQFAFAIQISDQIAHITYRPYEHEMEHVKQLLLFFPAEATFLVGSFFLVQSYLQLWIRMFVPQRQNTPWEGSIHAVFQAFTFSSKNFMSLEWQCLTGRSPSYNG